MESLINILVLSGIAGLCLFLIFFFSKRFTTKTYPKRTAAMLDNIQGLEKVGLERSTDKYSGYYKDYHVTIFPTTTPKQGDRFQVIVAVAPEEGQLKGITGFFTNYFVIGEKPGFAYAGFLFNPNATDDPSGGIQSRLNILYSKFSDAGVKPFKI